MNKYMNVCLKTSLKMNASERCKIHATLIAHADECQYEFERECE